MTDNYDPLKSAFDPNGSRVIVKDNTVTFEKDGKSETVTYENLSRDEILYITLGGTHEEYLKYLEDNKKEERKNFLRSQMKPGMRFRADKKLRDMYNSDWEIWELIRECPTLFSYGNMEVHHNERRDKWWCGPVGWRGQFETVLVVYNIPENFFFEPKDLPHPIDSVSE